MHLQRIVATNVGPFERAELNLDRTGVVLVVGPNNSGKSSLLSAVHSLAGGTVLLRYQGSASGAQSNVVGTFEITAEEREGWGVSPGSPLATHLQATVGQGVSHLMVRGPNGEYGALGSMGQQIDNGLQTLMSNWREGLFRFAVHRNGGIESRPAGGAERLAHDGSNLPNVLAHLQSNEEDKWYELRELMRTLVPSAGTLQLRLSGPHLRVVFTSKHSREMEIERLGTGVVQLLLSCTAALINGPGSVILCEEPEAYLHAAAQRAWMDHVAGWASSRLFLIATHSPVFLDHSAVSQTLLVEKGPGGSSSVEVCDPEKRSRALELLGVRLSDVLAAKRVLVVESEEDREVVNHWFGAWLREHGIVAVPGNGSSVASQIQTVQRIFDGSDLLPRNVRMLRDRDELTEEEVRRLAASGVFSLPCREMENFLLCPVAIAALIKAKHPGREVEASAIEAQLRHAAEELRAQKLVKLVTHSLLRGLPSARRTVVEETLRKDPPDIAALQASMQYLVTQVGEYRSSLDACWNTADCELRERWESEWRILVDGADVLRKVLKVNDCGFRKRRDVPQLARMIEAPSDLGAVLQRVLVSFDGE